MQNKITRSTPLLNNKGELLESGYSTRPLLQYQRSKIQANSLRIKEWDYYLIYNQDFALALGIADNSYVGIDTVSFIDFRSSSKNTMNKIRMFPRGETNMPSTSKIGDLSVVEKGYCIQFLNDGKERILHCQIDDFLEGEALTASITLTDEPEESLALAVPFKEDRKAFYYSHKIIGLKAKGMVEIGQKRYVFNPDNSLAVFDWVRGVWPYHNTKYWGSAVGYVENHLIGFNLGNGSEDVSQATENMVLIDGKLYKLDDVIFTVSDKEEKDSNLAKWIIADKEGRIQLEFTPLIEQEENLNLLVLSSNQHQIFGYYNGYILLKNDEKVVVKDFLGFVEKVVNKW